MDKLKEHIPLYFINPKDGTEMVLIPGGWFLMGSGKDDKEASANEKPRHLHYVEPFYMSIACITVGQFRGFVKEAGHKIDSNWGENPDNHPVRYVDWHDGKAYCAWAGRNVPVHILFKWLCSIKGITGITLSGGESTEQILALLPFLKDVRKKTNLSILIFSGRTLEQILKLPGGATIISLMDVLIDGHYDPEKANPPSVWPPSSNQRIHFLTNRYSETDFSKLPFYEAFISPSGEVIESGILLTNTWQIL